MRSMVEGLMADFDANGNVVGFDIDHASGKLDLSKIETIALPPAHAAEWQSARSKSRTRMPNPASMRSSSR